jgi:hypothetical protein
MNVPEARKTLRHLAEGMDPSTGELFPAESPYNHPQVIRALFVALEAFDAPNRPRKRNDSPTNAGKAWTPEEEQQLLSAFDTGTPQKDLARTHGRTQAAITARLEKLGRIEPSAEQAPV